MAAAFALQPHNQGVFLPVLLLFRHRPSQPSIQTPPTVTVPVLRTIQQSWWKSRSKKLKRRSVLRIEFLRSLKRWASYALYSEADSFLFFLSTQKPRKKSADTSVASNSESGTSSDSSSDGSLSSDLEDLAEDDEDDDDEDEDDEEEDKQSELSDSEKRTKKKTKVKKSSKVKSIFC